MTTPSPCNQDQRDQAIAWLLRLRDAPTDPGIRQAFAAWLEADLAHRAAYHQIEQQWAWMSQFEQQPLTARDEALRYRAKPRKPLWRKIGDFGMAALLILGIGWSLFSPQGWYGLPRSHSSGKNQRLTIALTDGSSVELNADSEVRVYFNRHQRHIDLVRGEAFFTVRHDSERPFTVHADDLLIRDIGTAFDVYKQAGQISVTVQEGIVEMTGPVEHREVTAGQQWVYGGDGHFIATPQTDVASTIAWRQGLLIFHGRPLKEVIAEICRYHDVDIRLPDARLAELKVNGSFRTEQLNELLNAAVSLLPVKIKQISEREIVLEAAGKP